MGKILAICKSEIKGIAKENVSKGEFIENHGLKGDAHAGEWHRQVSLLYFSKIDEFRKKGANVKFGDFGENIVVEGIDLAKLPIGTKLAIGDILLEVTQIGKECHGHCSIYYSVGDCIMPREGIFAKVVNGGYAEVGQAINIVE